MAQRLLSFAVAAAVLCSAAVPARSSGQTRTISTLGTATKASGFDPVWGQTFTAPGDAYTLLDFTMYFRAFPNEVDPLHDQPLGYLAALQGWDGQGLEGPVLWSSTGAAPNDFTSFLFNVGVPVTPNSQYVFFMAVQPLRPAGDKGWNYGGTLLVLPGMSQDYAGGAAVRVPLGTSVFTTLSDRDLAFEADFATTPEPASLLLFGVGLAGLEAARRKRKQSRRV